MFKNIICPISSEKVNSHVSRLTVFIQVVILIYFLITLQPIYLYLVTIDCAMRAIGKNRYSLLNNIASYLIKLLGTTPKLTDKAPKVFASRLGFICGLAGSICIALNLSTATIIIIGMWTALAILDSVFDFCVGCLIYNYLVFPFYNNK
jgi:hypothetical protein